MLRIISLFTWIFSLHVYFAMFMAFVSSRKNPLVNLSCAISGLATIWVFCSVAFKLGVSPSPALWFKLSIFSLSLIPYVIYLLLRKISGEKLLSRISVSLMVLAITMAALSLTDFYYDCSYVLYRESWIGGLNIADLFDVELNARWGSLFIIAGESLIIVLTIRKLFLNRNLEYRRLFLIASFLYWLSGMVSLVVPELVPLEIIGGLVNVVVLLFVLRDRNALKMELFIKPQTFPLFSSLLILIFSGLLLFRDHGNLRDARDAIILTMAGTAIFGGAMTLLYEYLYQRLFTDRGDYLLKCNSQYHDELMEKLGDIDAISSGFLNAIRVSFGEGDVALYVYDEEKKGYALMNPGRYEKSVFAEGDPLVSRISTFRGISNAYSVEEFINPDSRLHKDIRDGYARWITPLRVNGALLGFFFGGGFNSRYIDSKDKETLVSMIRATSLALQETYMMHRAAFAAITDPMTGLSRFSRVKALITDMVERNRHFIAMLFSIDDLDIFNMVYSQSAGDELLQVFSSTLKIVSDDKAILGRVSGKNFTAILECSMVEAIEFDEELRTSFRLANAEGIGHSITFSTGAMEVKPEDDIAAERVFANLEIAVNRAKRNGKNQLKVYDDSMLEEGSYGESEFRIRTVEAISNALDLKDHFTYSHSINVASYARALAEAAGLDPLDCETVYQAGLVHDIGKISVPDSILLNPGKLTPEEYETVKTHVDRSEEVIKSLPLGFRMLPIALSHHERWDGNGYPNGLSGQEIPIGGRCLSIADTFDAMTSRRVYKRALSIDEALDEILKCSGTQFDPDLGPLFVKLVRDGVITPHPSF